MDISSEWISIEPNPLEIYKITIYDDGNKQYENYENRWLVFGEWRGKYALVNEQNYNIKINSISQWKVIKII